MAKTEVLTVREAARILDVGVSTLKRWADLGILQSFRTPGGHRRFARRDVERYRDTRTGHPERKWLELILNEDEPLVVSAELLRARATHGCWWRVADELGSALTELGRRWERGEVAVLDEHAASSRLARALQWAAHTIPMAQDAPLALLAMAPGDDHTLGLQLAECPLREAGWNIRWAGRMTPIDCIIAAIDSQELQMVALSASSLLDTASDALAALHARVAAACRAARVRLLVGGRGAWPRSPGYGDRVRSFGELHQLLSNEAAA